MPKNIAAIYKDKRNLLKQFNGILHSALLGEKNITSELSCPVVVDDSLAKKWLEMNYLFATGFRPHQRPGVGEIGADIKKNDRNGKKYLTVHFGLLNNVVRALADFRTVENSYAEWQIQQKAYEKEISGLQKQIQNLSKNHPQLQRFQELFGETKGYIGWQYIGLPSEKFVQGLQDLNEALKTIKHPQISESLSITTRLHQELSKYSSLIPQLSKIREYHKKVPHISDGMIFIDSPAASGGICMHTHPGHDDPYHSLPSPQDSFILIAQIGFFPNIVHVGGGETQGEHYIMHVPRKYFFDEVKHLVDSRGVSDEYGIIQIKKEVLNKRLDDIMEDEILGFKIAGKDGKAVVLNPVITEREYRKHKKQLKSKEPFEVEDLLLATGYEYVHCVPEVTEFLAKNLGKPVEKK